MTDKQSSGDTWGEWLAEELFDAFQLCVVFAFLAVIRLAAEFFKFRLWPSLQEVIDHRWFALVGTASVFIAGLGLYFLRKHCQRLYGLAEVGFALTASWSIMKNAEAIGSVGSWLAVLATAYLVVRGLTNYAEARKTNRLATR